jgi:hypothetical protein
MTSVPNSVPDFNEYYAPVGSASQEVQAFYRWLRTEIAVGRAPDIDGNISYLFAHIYETIDEFLATRDYAALRGNFDFIREHYSHTKVPRYVDGWQSDAALWVGEWEDAWTYRKGNLGGVRWMRLVTAHLSGSPRLCHDDVRALAGQAPLTQWGSRRRAQIDAAINTIVDQLHDEEDSNYVDAFCDGVEANPEAWDRSAAEALADDLDYGLTSDELRDRLVSAVTYQEPAFGRDDFRWSHSNTYSLFNATGRNEATVELPQVPRLAIVAIPAKSRWIIREAENLARTEAGLPRIGDGWISETELFQIVRDGLPGVRVQRHARPKWLAPQHLDVYLPDANIGIEFQGEQHYGPVDFFGGEAAFEGQSRRDQRKRKLCSTNHCLLIELAAGYDPDALLQRLRDHLAV